MSQVPVILPEITQILELQATCLTKKTPTCVLAFLDPSDTDSTKTVTDAYEKLLKKVPQTFQLYQIESSSPLAISLVTHFGLEGQGLKIIVLNYRGWYRRYSGEAKQGTDILDWLDSVRLGEGKKEKIPEEFLEEAEAELKKQQDKIIEASKKMVEEMGGEKEESKKKMEHTAGKKAAKEEVEEEVKEEEHVKDEL